jgi:Tol biopolymer transport system component
LQDGVPTEIPENFDITGAIAYKDGELDGFYTLGGSPFILSRLPILGKEGDEWRGILFGFSPNGEWLSYAPIVGEIGPIDVKHEVLRIGSLSFNGMKIENDVDVDEFDAILPDNKPSIGWFVNRWINDGLIHSTLAYRENGQMMISHFNSVLNPFDGKWRDELITGLPGSTRKDGAFYSPDMTRVIYLRKKHGLVLRDINIDDQIWVDNDFISIYGGIVEWAPDSSLTAYRNVGTSDEIFIMDRNGNNVTDIVDGLSDPVKPRTGSVFRWSPVDHQLAFTVFQGGIINQKTLYIYDVNTNDIVYSCPLYQSEREGDIDFYWSPDGRQIAYSYFHYDPLIVIDIQTGQVFKLVDKAIIHGWSGKFPAILPADD